MRRWLLIALAAVAAAGVTAAPAVARCHTNSCKRRIVRPYNAKLLRMAYCESGRNGHIRWHINTGSGYYGGLQFGLPAWREVGGRGLPSNNTPLEQKFRAVLLIRRHGYAPWPVCGYR